jgi:hypothetical protein
MVKYWARKGGLSTPAVSALPASAAGLAQLLDSAALTAYRHDFVAWHPPRIGTPHLSFDVWRQGKDSRRERRR